MNEPKPTNPAGAVSAPKSKIGVLMSKTPTIIVLLSLLGLAAWGHQTGWKAPKFSTLVGTAPTDKEDWCTEHGVPDSSCIKCHPELVGANMKDWCPEHGVPESKCTICHPEILKTGVAGDWCPEHGLPESSCTLCHPEIAVKGELKNPGAVSVFASPESLSGKVSQLLAGAVPATQPAKDPKTCQTHALRVQFAFPESVLKAGVGLSQVVERSMSDTLLANAETDYDRTRYAELATPVPGRVWRVLKQVGDSINQGDVLALIDSAEVGKGKAELLQAAADLNLRREVLKRMTASIEQGFRTAAEYQEAIAAEQSAKIRLFNARQSLINLGLPASEGALPDVQDPEKIRFLGIPADVVKSLDATTATANLLPLTSPQSGIVLDQRAVAGVLVDPANSIYVVADPSRLWLVIDLPQADAKRIAVGQSVMFQPDAAPDSGARGEISWVSTAVEEKTRTIRVRAVLENPQGALLAKSFGKARIALRDKPTAIAVRDEAIQWEGCCYVAFVRLTDTIFQTRKVKLGAKSNGFTEIIGGLLPGEVVATEGSHVLKSELLKSALGAGCTDH